MTPSILELRWGDRTATLSCDRPELTAFVARIFRNFLDSPPPDQVALPEGPVRLLLNDEALHYDDFGDAVVDAVHLLEELLRPDPWPGLLIHAAAVTDGDRTLIIPGASGSGKTTTAIELARRGYRYLTDEYAALDAAGTRLFPFPRGAMLKSPRPASPPGDHVHVRIGWGYRCYVTPDHSADLDAVDTGPISLIFPVRLQPGEPPGATRIDAADAVARLIPCTWYFIEEEARVWPILSDLAVRCDAVELRWADMQRDLDAALALLEVG